MKETLDGRIKDEPGDNHQGYGIDEGGQHSGTPPSVGFGAGGRPLAEKGGDPGEQERKEVGDIMSGFGEQRQAVRPESRSQQQDNIGQSTSQGKAQHPRGERGMSVAMGVSGVEMHGWSLRRCAPGFKPPGMI